MNRATSYINYKSCIAKLNSLISNAVAISEIAAKKHNLNYSMEMINFYLNKLNISNNDLNGLNIIHISGTKGKGSTGAMIESILRQHGLKTGFYSSPHLMEVRERIKINGISLSYSDFSKYFDSIYSTIVEENSNQSTFSKPGFFCALTILAFHVFLHEMVDVVILETGIGGRFDCTNIVNKPLLTIITQIDYDHMNILGNTIEEIAWQKAGIIKPYCPVLTRPQIPTVHAVIDNEARAKHTQTIIVDNSKFKPLPYKIGISGKHQLGNARLAISACDIVMRNDIFRLQLVNKKIEDGLVNISWPGRCQKIVTDDIYYYLDGSHTPLSIDCGIKWFAEESVELNPIFSDKKSTLVFNCTGDRNSEYFLNRLLVFPFHRIILTTNCLMETTEFSDILLDRSEHSKELDKCYKNSDILKRRNFKDTFPEIIVIPSVSETCKYISSNSRKDMRNDVFVTGSLHLVGAFLAYIYAHPYDRFK